MGEEKLVDNISTQEKGLLPEGWKQQDGAEILLHPEGRDCDGSTTPGPTLLDRESSYDEEETEEKLRQQEVLLRKKNSGGE